MQLSLRSQMIAGVAALGVTAVAIAPLSSPALAPSMARVSTPVELSALVNPISAIASVGAYLSDDLFSSVQWLGPDELVWPDGFYNSDFSFVYAPAYVGAIPDAANQFSFGTLSALVSNLSGYAQAGLSTLSVVEGVSSAIWNTPTAVVAAVGYLAAGDTASALAVLQTEILAPLQAGIAQAVAGVGFIIDNVIGNVQSLAGITIPGLIANVGSSVVGSISYMVQSAVTTVTQVVTDLAGLQFEAAWNDAVLGLLGPNGTLGQIESFTAGVGIFEDLPYDDGQGGTIVLPTVVVPSLRAVATSTLQRMGDYRSLGDGGILNDPFEPLVTAPAAAPARRAAAATVAVPSAVAAVEASAEASAEAQSAEAPAPKSVAKHVGRQAAGAKAAAGKAAAAAGRAAAAK
ncbi:MAG: hypothetical protein ACR2JI_15640 [Mycobacterium sp.]